MKLYFVDPACCYGVFGAVVIADNEEKAKELFVEKYPHHIDRVITVSFLTDDFTKEFVGEEILE